MCSASESCARQFSSLSLFSARMRRRRRLRHFGDEADKALPWSTTPLMYGKELKRETNSSPGKAQPAWISLCMDGLMRGSVIKPALKISRSC